MVMRLPSRFMATTSGTVSFLGGAAAAPPYAESWGRPVFSVTRHLRPGRLAPVPANEGSLAPDVERAECVRMLSGPGAAMLRVPLDVDVHIQRDHHRAQRSHTGARVLPGAAGRSAGSVRAGPVLHPRTRLGEQARPAALLRGEQRATGGRRLRAVHPAHPRRGAHAAALREPRGRPDLDPRPEGPIHARPR